MTEESKKGKQHMDNLIDDATEAEADSNRHRMEEAILATLAKGGPDDPFNETFFHAYDQGTLTFSRSDLKTVAEALSSLVCLDHITADAVLLRDKLRSARVKNEVLTGILDGSKAVDAAVAREYIEKLHALDKYRRAHDAWQEYLKAVEKAKQEGGEVEGAFADLATTFFDLATGKKLLRDYPVEAEAAEGFLDILNARRDDKRHWLGLDCGFDHLNEVLNGLTEGVFILVGAPSCGKTTLAKQIADHVAATEKVPVLFYSFEQSAEEVRIKSLARLASVDSRVIWKGRTGSEVWGKVEKADEDYRKGSGPYLTIIEAGRKDTVEAIRATAIMTKHKAGDKPILLILDYLQIIPAGKDAPDTLREKADWNLSELRRLSRDIKSPVLVVSSENRAGYKGNPKPTLAALQESGGIEYSADAIICLWRDKEESKRLMKEFTLTSPTPKIDRIEAYVLKNRNGELARVKLNFTKVWTMFEQQGKKEDLDYDAVLGKLEK